MKKDDIIFWIFQILFWCLIIALIIFRVSVFLEYKDVPLSDTPAWVIWVLGNR